MGGLGWRWAAFCLYTTPHLMVVALRPLAYNVQTAIVLEQVLPVQLQICPPSRVAKAAGDGKKHIQVGVHVSHEI